MQHRNSCFAMLGAAALISGAPASAQPCPGHWVQTGAAGVASRDGLGGAGQLLSLPTGQLLVLGGFTIAGSTGVQEIALYDPPTQSWSSLGWAFGNNWAFGDPRRIGAAAVLPSGDLIVAGLFDSVAGQPAHNVAIYHTQSQTWSPAGDGVSRDDIYLTICLTVLPNGDVIAGGNFTHVSDQNAVAMARYSPAANTWTAIPGLASGYIGSLAATPAGDIIVSGVFTLSGESRSRYLARYSPSSGVWSNMGLDPNAGVNVVRALPNGNIAIGGAFAGLGPGFDGFNHLAIYNPITNVWSRVQIGVSGGSSATVYDIVQTPDGNIVACGNFTSAGAGPASCIAYYRPSYNQWFSMGSGFGGNSPPIGHLAVLPGGDLVTSGSFFSVDGVNAKSIARWTPATNSWSPLSPGLVTPITAAAPLPGGEYLVAARFSGHLAYLARYNPHSNSWSPMPDAVDGSISAMTPLPSGDILVGGYFTHAGATPAPGLAIYHPASDTWTPLPSGVSGGQYFTLDALAVLNGDFIVAGLFTTAGTNAVTNIARYSPATNQWSSLGSGRPNALHALYALPDGDLLAGGYSGGLSRYHPATNSWTSLPISSVNAITALPNGDIVAGGLGGSSLTRYSPSTGATTPIPGLGFNNTVSALAYVEPNQLLVGGDVYVSGVPSSHLGRLDLDSGAWTGFGASYDGTGIDGGVSFLQSLPGGDFLLSGEFTRAGTVPSGLAARWVASAADFNHDGDIGTDADIESFFQCLSGSCCPLCSADFNGDGDVGTDADIEAFFRVLAGGNC